MSEKRFVIPLNVAGLKEIHLIFNRDAIIDQGAFSTSMMQLNHGEYIAKVTFNSQASFAQQLLQITHGAFAAQTSDRPVAVAEMATSQAAFTHGSFIADIIQKLTDQGVITSHTLSVSHGHYIAEEIERTFTDALYSTHTLTVSHEAFIPAFTTDEQAAFNTMSLALSHGSFTPMDDKFLYSTATFSTSNAALSHGSFTATVEEIGVAAIATINSTLSHGNFVANAKEIDVAAFSTVSSTLTSGNFAPTFTERTASETATFSTSNAALSHGDFAAQFNVDNTAVFSTANISLSHGDFTVNATLKGIAAIDTAEAAISHNAFKPTFTERIASETARHSLQAMSLTHGNFAAETTTAAAISYVDVDNQSVDEEQPVGTHVANILCDATGATYTLSGTGAQNFSISGETIVTAKVLDYENEVDQVNPVTLTATLNGASVSVDFMIYVNDIAEGLTDGLTPTETYAEGTTFGAWLDAQAYTHPMTWRMPSLTLQLNSTGIIMEKGAPDFGIGVWCENEKLKMRIGGAGSQNTADTLFLEAGLDTLAAQENEYHFVFVPGDVLRLELYANNRLIRYAHGGSYPTLANDAGGGAGVKGGTTVPVGVLDQPLMNATFGAPAERYANFRPAATLLDPEEPYAPPATVVYDTSQYLSARYDAVVGTEWNTGTDTGSIPFIQPNTYSNVEPATEASISKMTTTELEGGDYKVHIKMKNYGGSGDSFFVRVNGGVWHVCNNISSVRDGTGYYWDAMWLNDDPTTHLTFTVPSGKQTVEIGRRENCRISQIYITKNGDTPTG